MQSKQGQFRPSVKEDLLSGIAMAPSCIEAKALVSCLGEDIRESGLLRSSGI